MLRRVVLGLSLLAGASPGCSEADPGLPAGTCEAVLWGQAQRGTTTLGVRGSWDDWREVVPMQAFEQDPWQYVQLALPPGEYGYLVIEADRGRLDPFNPLGTYRPTDEQEVSLLRVEDCERSQVIVESARSIGPSDVAWTIAIEPGISGEPIDPSEVRVAIDGASTPELRPVEGEPNRFEVYAKDMPRGRHHLAIELEREQTEAAGWVAPVAEQLADEVIYQVMIDRFRGPAGMALQPPPAPGARAGGTLDGVTAEIERGTFEDLGVSMLWLSPVYVNPDEPREGLDGRSYEGYHGYWPLRSRAVDPRLGGERALHELVDTAHRHGIRVLLDLVPNHLYEANPRVAELGPAAFHPVEPPCICGTPSCPWNDFIESCWFTPYLPDFRFEHPDVLPMVMDDAVWWLDTFDVDGFRIDAVPMMPRTATRRILDAIRRASPPRSSTFALAEIFTGPGAGGLTSIRYHLGPDGFDSAFDFPLMWALRDAIALDGPGFVAVDRLLDRTDAGLDGSQAVLARMLDNHDTTRFVSESNGDASRSGWGSTPPEQPIDPAIYDKQALALGLLLTLPGIVVMYYGDEIGLAGGSDPDNRRVMPSQTAWTDEQVRLRDRVGALARLRRCLPALRRGIRRTAVAHDDRYAFVRDAADGRPAVVLLTRSASEDAITLSSSIAGLGIPPGWYKDALSGDRFELGRDSVVIPLASRSLRVLVPLTDPCG